MYHFIIFIIFYILFLTGTFLENHVRTATLFISIIAIILFIKTSYEKHKRKSLEKMKEIENENPFKQTYLVGTYQNHYPSHIPFLNDYVVIIFTVGEEEHFGFTRNKSIINRCSQHEGELKFYYKGDVILYVEKNKI